jgi:serine/threonine protein kinase
MDNAISMRDFEGQTIADKYQLIRYIHEGGFGAVYEACHVAYELPLRTVAIKIAKKPMSNREARDVFHDALTMAHIADNEPDLSIRQHFVTVHDAGLCPDSSALAGHPYVVMEMIRGGSLRTCLRAGPLPLKRAVDYFDQMLRAVAYMHQCQPRADGSRQRLIHRDIKPDNVLVDRRQSGQDIIKMTDFGLAVPVDTLLGWATSGGDLAYMAPESFSHKRCSTQTDVYMLALVFYEMITNHSPFLEVGAHLQGSKETQRAELERLHLAARLNERFPLIENHPEVRQRPALGQVVLKALRTDAFEDAGEFRRAWLEAKEDRRDRSLTKPWEKVRQLVVEARQFLAVQDEQAADERLRQAMAINRDPLAVPDPMTVGEAYLLYVERLIRQDRKDEAVSLAQEAYRRRRCRSTCQAMACCSPAPLAASFERESRDCGDQT